MNKALELLEQYCQWLAIALGGIFLALMAWWYLLFSPVAVQAGGQTLTPANVDDVVNRNYAESLDREMHREQTETPPAQHVAAVEQWDARLNGTAEPVVTLRPDWPASIPQDVKLATDTGPTTQKAQVAQLPDVPPAETMELKSARAYVSTAVAQPGQPAPVPQPPAANGQPVAAGRDLSYVRLEYRIAPEEIAKKFSAVNIPAIATTTSVEAVTTYRQEQLPDGSWGEPVVVALLNNGVQVYPPPPAGSPPQVIAQYRSWSESQQGQTDILRPTFYSVIQGEGPWDQPADQLPVVDPAVELQKKRDAYKAAQEAARQKRMQNAGSRTPPGMGDPGMPPGGGGRGYGRGGRGGAGAEPLQWPQARPPYMNYPPGTYPPGAGQRPPGAPPFGDPNMGPDGMDPSMQPQQQAPGSGQSGANPLPAPVFRPSDTPPFVGWAFDETVGEGKTYRYQVLYAIRNPVYQANIVADPKMAQQFLLWSKLEDTAWSQPVLVKPSTEYFLSGANWTSNTPNSVRMEVFKWSEGKWQSHIFNVSPGDEIGGVEGQTDFSTNATLVDIRYDRYDVGGARAFALVLAPDGKLVEHDPTADRNSPRLAQLRQLVQMALNPNGVNPTDPNNPGGALPPGVPGGAGYPPGGGYRPGMIPPQ
ncbi:MAG: hypothetical protein ACTHLZ_16865 [Tepidisphaeraceae bacterium]